MADETTTTTVPQYTGPGSAGYKGGGLGSTTDLIGVPTGTKAPAGHDQQEYMLAPNTSDFGRRTGGAQVSGHGRSMITQGWNQYGGVAIDPMYHNNDEWAPQNDPGTILELQAQMVQAGIVKASALRLGQWDDKSANVYRTVLAMANAGGGTADQVLQWLIDNPKFGAAGKGGAGVVGGTSVQLQNPADIRLAYQTAAENLTGGDLPASQADAFLHQVQVGEMQKASVDAQGGTFTAPMSAEAFIRQNQGADVAAYNGLQRGLEFMRILGVV